MAFKVCIGKKSIMYIFSDLSWVYSYTRQIASTIKCVYQQITYKVHINGFKYSNAFVFTLKRFCFQEIFFT